MTKQYNPNSRMHTRYRQFLESAAHHVGKDSETFKAVGQAVSTFDAFEAVPDYGTFDRAQYRLQCALRVATHPLVVRDLFLASDFFFGIRDDFFDSQGTVSLVVLPAGEYEDDTKV